MKCLLHRSLSHVARQRVLAPFFATPCSIAVRLSLIGGTTSATKLAARRLATTVATAAAVVKDTSPGQNCRQRPSTRNCYRLPRIRALPAYCRPFIWCPKDRAGRLSGPVFACPNILFFFRLLKHSTPRSIKGISCPETEGGTKWRLGRRTMFVSTFTFAFRGRPTLYIPIYWRCVLLTPSDPWSQ